MPKVSVIIPVYNTEKYLKKCLDSICSQTLSDIEIICIDDCSTDNSLKILKEYANNDSRIKLIEFKENKGASVARNTGIKEALGEYIGFIDSDDYIDFEFYEKLYSKGINKTADIVKGSLYINQDNSLNRPNWHVNSNDFLEQPAKFIYGFTSAIYRTQLIKRNKISFPESIKNLEDPYFLIWAVAKSTEFLTDESANYYYQIHDESLTHTTMPEEFVTGALKISELLNSLNITKEHYITVAEFILNAMTLNNIENEQCSKYLNSLLYKKDIMLNRIKKIRNVSKVFQQKKINIDDKISVIIPIYKVEKYLAKCLDSVINQTYKNLEIICVNDCTPDKSIQILKKYAEKDDRIIIFNREVNGGLSAARNSGLRIATGEYVYFLDSDDWIDLDYLEKMMEAARFSQCDIVLNTNIKKELENGSSENFEWSRYTLKNINGEFVEKYDAINKTQVMIWCHLYKKSFLDKYNLTFPEGFIHEDEYFQHISKINIDKIYTFCGAEYHYFQRETSIMQTRTSKIIPILKIYNLLIDFYKDKKSEANKVNLFNKYWFTEITNEEEFKFAKKAIQKTIELSFSNLIKTNYQKYLAKNILDSDSYQRFKEKVGKYPLILYQVKGKVLWQKNIKVSIIIPIFNTEKYLEKCLESVTNQSLEDIEIICVNDCSTDNSLEILKDFMAEDNRIKLIDFKENQGVSIARNEGIKIAKGEYIGFVDSDDWIELDFYEKLYKKAKEEDADITKGNLLFYANDKIISDKYYNIDEVLKNKHAFMHFSSAIYKKSFIDKFEVVFPEKILVGEDSYFEITAAINANKIVVVRETYYYYFQRPSSVLHKKTVSMYEIQNYAKSQNLTIKLINDHIDDIEDYKTALKRKFNCLMRYCENKNILEDERKYIIQQEQKIKEMIKFPEIIPELERISKVQLVYQKQMLKRIQNV